MQKNTLIVNLFGGPGVGKSTTSADLFARLKRKGYEVELVTEEAKDQTWEENWGALANQWYITGCQIQRLWRVYGKVDMVVMDSPILTGLAYQGFGCGENFERAVIDAHKAFKYNLNIILGRNPKAHPYKESGRSQSEEEAAKIDATILDILNKAQVLWYRVVVSEDPDDYMGLLESTVERVFRGMNQLDLPLSPDRVGAFSL